MFVLGFVFPDMTFGVRALFCATIIVALSAVTFGERFEDATADQLEFLAELYNSTSGVTWKNNTNWLVNGTSICDWFGVTCAGKWVQKLDLSSNELGGPLPDEWERAPYLDTIDLSSNQ